MENLEQAIIGQLVADNYHTAAIFKKFNIDFCCKGNISVGEACRQKNISPSLVTAELAGVRTAGPGAMVDYNSWGLDVLASHIWQTHHAYVDMQIPVIKPFLHKLCSVHGSRHPELYEINKLFAETAAELTMHMKKEELMLFPYIRQMAAAKLEGSACQPPVFGSVISPIAVMMHEHNQEGERFARMTALSDDFTPPEDACNTYRVTYGLLKEFRDDLHLHIHLENNILFPKAVIMEESMRGAGESYSVERR
ncbi:iron-sulfur cluster repair di-iron protein [Chitinophaga alhagiae]|uniref:iron-sulfur cluster repair di-iron protein n=1 Tax=Chitinophaga alhagiae TaxID=2203219 RepID=UPI000E5A31CA|nr:iron-sulfur cluster repair di-iron protein [Chitinophaga alhagiae]